jgi:hypothetical protein
MAQFILPGFLSDQFQVDKLEMVNVCSLRVGLVDLNSGCIRYIPVNRTPHYYFVKSVINNESELELGGCGYLNYSHYSEVNSKTCPPGQFIELINKIIEGGYNYTHCPILAFRHWRRPLPISRLDVADGFHRLSVLAALGETKIMVCKLKYKNNIILRFVNRSTNFFFMD